MKIELDLPVPNGWKLLNYSYGADPIKENITMNTTITFERIEPEIDTELEEARKKYIGKYVKSKNRENFLYKIIEVRRCNVANVHSLIVLNSGIWDSFYETEVELVPIPVWRCCESDKPKVGRYYPVRKNKSLTYDLIRFDDSGFWDTDLLISKFEWLDEGEV
jgi:hypothetical protein